jgi:type I restriction enzyme S subunit
VRLGDVVDLRNGFPFKSAGFNEHEGTPVIRIRDVLPGVPGTYYRGAIDAKKMPSVRNDDIVIGMDGDFNAVRWNGGTALLNQRVCALRSDDRFYEQRFLQHALPGYLKLIHQNTSAVTVKHLSSRTILDIPLPLPPREEQRRIVDKIDTLFAQLEKGEEALIEVQNLLARYRQSVLTAAVTGELTADWRAENADRLESGRELLARILQARRERWAGRGKYTEPPRPDTSDLPKLPPSWEWALGAQLFRWSSGKFLPKKNLRAGDVPVYGGNGINGHHSASLVDAPTIVVGRVGAHCGNVHLTSSPAWITDNAIYATQTPSQSDLTYLSMIYSAARLGQQAMGGAQPFVNQQALNAVRVPLPPVEEQAEIMSKVRQELSGAESAADLVSAEVSRSDALRASILRAAFSGQLVEQHPADEPASDLLERIKGKQSALSPRRKLKQVRQ